MVLKKKNFVSKNFSCFSYNLSIGKIIQQWEPKKTDEKLIVRNFLPRTKAYKHECDTSRAEQKAVELSVLVGTGLQGK